MEPQFLRDLAEKLNDPSNPLLHITQKERKQIGYQLRKIAQDRYQRDGRFSRLFLIAIPFEGHAKDFLPQNLDSLKRKRWADDLCDLADTLDFLPPRFQSLRHPDHPKEIIVIDTQTERKVYLSPSEYRTFVPMLSKLFGDI